MKPFLAVKMKNELLAINPKLKVELKNVTINGNKLGCSGFVTDPETGRTVYVNSDNNHGMNRTAYYRAARHTKDFTGGLNHSQRYEDLSRSVVSLLTSTHFNRELPASSK